MALVAIKVPAASGPWLRALRKSLLARDLQVMIQILAEDGLLSAAPSLLSEKWRFIHGVARVARDTFTADTHVLATIVKLDITPLFGVSPPVCRAVESHFLHLPWVLQHFWALDFRAPCYEGRIAQVATAVGDKDHDGTHEHQKQQRAEQDQLPQLHLCECSWRCLLNQRPLLIAGNRSRCLMSHGHWGGIPALGTLHRMWRCRLSLTRLNIGIGIRFIHGVLALFSRGTAAHHAMGIVACSRFAL
mmetsp:Transcript_83247/g.131668  ORF Transcript_83247/g.131668 Transcript_83247/m.131668 type:complete len:246 (-) Transcript_83247:17-754(-)